MRVPALYEKQSVPATILLLVKISMLPILSKNQLLVLLAIETYITKYNKSPLMREIAAATKLNINTVKHLVLELQKIGYITRRRHEQRNIRLLNAGENKVRVLGSISSAGIFWKLSI